MVIKLKRVLGYTGAAVALPLSLAQAEEIGWVTDLQPYPVIAPVANEIPADGFSQLMSGLRWEPRIDLQTRGGPERQSDISIRGGIFEGTGFLLGGLPVMDPQTGHYFGELPLDPVFLGNAQVLTGALHGRDSFNSTAGSVAYRFTPIQTSGAATAGFGLDNLNYQNAHVGWNHGKLGWQIAGGRSEGDGSIDNGDFDFERLSARIQYKVGETEVNVFAGYVDKFYGWPGMYTGNAALPETDHYRIFMGGVDASGAWSKGEWSSGFYFRRLADEYRYHRFNTPPPTALFEHETEVWAGHFTGSLVLTENVQVVSRTVLVSDELVRSTSLRSGTYSSREYLKWSVVPEWVQNPVDGTGWKVRAGLALDTGNRNSTRLSPLAGVSWKVRQASREWEWFADAVQSTQVPGYTAIKSSATGGLFRGREDLNREVSRSVETGVSLAAGEWTYRATGFWRKDEDLADWTYSPTVARQASPMDVDVYGVELLAVWHRGRSTLSVGYAWLEKDSDYKGQAVSASYYVLNYAKHRLTASWRWEWMEGLESLLDVELRDQAANPLRTGRDEAFRVAVGVTWQPQFLPGWELAVRGENLTNDHFQDIPGTASEGRRASVGVTYRW